MSSAARCDEVTMAQSTAADCLQVFCGVEPDGQGSLGAGLTLMSQRTLSQIEPFSQPAATA